MRFALEVCSAFAFQLLSALGLILDDFVEFFIVPDNEELQIKARVSEQPTPGVLFPSLRDVFNLYTPFLRTWYAFGQIFTPKLCELRTYHLFGVYGSRPQRVYPVVPLYTVIAEFRAHLLPVRDVLSYQIGIFCDR